MSVSRPFPAWVWPAALGLFLVGAVVFGRTFKAERQRVARVCCSAQVSAKRLGRLLAAEANSRFRAAYKLRR